VRDEPSAVITAKSSRGTASAGGMCDLRQGKTQDWCLCFHQLHLSIDALQVLQRCAVCFDDSHDRLGEVVLAIASVP